MYTYQDESRRRKALECGRREEDSERREKWIEKR